MLTWLKKISRSRYLNYLRYLYVVFVTLYGGGMTYLVLQPEVGFDDANIAHAYAKNIAHGHGYVYNIAGERVEGSTSIIWTLLNSVFFYLFDSPELMLGLFSMLLTGMIIFTTCKTAECFFTNAAVRPAAFFLSGFVFTLFPAFFGWTVWSLMDMTIWILSISVLSLCLSKWYASLIVRQALAQPWVGLYYLTILLVPLVRPEGIALAIGLSIFMFAYAFVTGKSIWRMAIITVCLSLFTFISSIIVRLMYFGYPFPNTYYAKTSTHILEQALQGLSYTLGYFMEWHYLLLLIIFILAVIIILRSTKEIHKFIASLSAAAILGGLIIYTLLGGDHFGSYRFFLYFLVLEIPVVSFLLIQTWGRFYTRRVSASSKASLAIGLMLLLFIVQTTDFVVNKGGYQHEFWIAEHGRYVGERLNDFPGAPSLGVLAAGGIRMGFQGKVYDMLGLNWTKMAHAESDDKASVRKNHGAFNSSVFMATLPDIFYANEMTCPQHPYRFNSFFDSITDGIIYQEQFSESYTYVCWQDLTFFISRRFETKLASTGDLPELRYASYIKKTAP